ncbi:hypothetical protein ON010_g10521 [Phytophthora cinnamomi]|nr:hypothetical protein ON010_g10521 [Phytophthora cinnamomi]
MSTNCPGRAHEAARQASHSLFCLAQPPTPTSMKLGISLIIGVLSLAVARGDSFIKSTYSGSKGLNDLAKATGRYMGTATDIGELSDPYYVKQLKNISDFGMITPGNAMKWDATEPSQNSFSFTKGDQVVALAKASGAKVRCHTLVWHQQVPSWVQTLGKAELLKALENHITKVITHFGDSCYAWDVVNEAMGDDGTYRNLQDGERREEVAGSQDQALLQRLQHQHHQHEIDRRARHAQVVDQRGRRGQRRGLPVAPELLGHGLGVRPNLQYASL